MTRLIRKARLLALLSLGAATGCRPRDGRPTTQQRELMHTSFEELVGRAPQVLPTLTTAKAHTGKYAMRVDPEHPYSFTYRATLGSLCTHRPRRFTLSAWAWVSSFQDNAVVVAVLSNPSDPNHPLLTKYLYLSDNNSLGQWNHVSRDLDLPASIHAGTELVVYLWKVNASQPVYVDDLRLTELW